MKEENLSSTVISETESSETIAPSTGKSIQRDSQGLVRRRSFLQGLGLAGVALSTGALVTDQGISGNIQLERAAQQG